MTDAAYPATQGIVTPVRTPAGRLSDDLRAVRVVWRRELIRFFRNRTRIVTSLVQPVLFLFVLGTGLSPILPVGHGHLDFRTFMFPGILAMAVLFTAIFSAVSIVWDREFGFLREMLVAPVRRGALVLGKCLGGATVATVQGAIMLALAGVVHVPYAPLLILELVALLALMAFALTSFGVLVASRIASVESFQMVMQFLVLPMFFLSGAVFPLTRLPQWLQVLTRLDPLSYAVDPMRRAVFAYLPGQGGALRTFSRGLTWDGWHLPVVVEVGVVAALALAALSGAVVRFAKVD